MHGPRGALGVAGNERGEDGLVLDDRIGIAPRRGQEQAPYPFGLRAGGFHHLRDAAKGKPREKRRVEADIERVEFLDIAGRGRG